MIRKISLSLGLLSALLATGCATRSTVNLDPKVMQEDGEFFRATATPKCNAFGCNAFILSIKNKTNKELEVNWNKTLYISGGQTSGGFMSDGVIYRDRNNSRASDIIFAYGEFSKLIFPNNLAEFSSGRYGGWSNSRMPFGDNGIYLTVIVDGKEVTQKLVTNITVTRVKR